MRIIVLIPLAMIFLSCTNKNPNDTTMNKIEIIDKDLKSHDNVMAKLATFAKNADADKTFAKHIKEWFSIGTRIFFSEDTGYGSGIIADRLIELEDKTSRINYLLKPIHKNPFEKEVFGSWKVDYKKETYKVTVFVDY